MLSNLACLYGESGARPVYDRVRALMDQYSPRLPRAVTESREWTEREVLLITYADQVRSEGAPPLQVLAEFLNAHAPDILSGVHILPFFPYSSDDGFSVVDYTAVDPGLGSWDDLERLGEQFDLMFDLVLNHVSAQSEWFRGFLKDDPVYRHFFIAVEGDPDLTRVVRPRALPLLTTFKTPSGEKRVWTTFSADQIDLNYHNPDVLLKMLEVLLLYVERGARFVRLDAIAYLWKELGTSCIHLPQTHAMVRLLRAVLDQVAPGVRLITETNVPHADNIAYFGNGTDEAQMVYNFALPPLVLHTLQTGSAAKLSRWAADLTLPSGRVTCFNFLASHDGIGLNPARGILAEAEIEALIERTVERGGLVSYKRNEDGSQSPYELDINYFDALYCPGEGDEALVKQVGRFMTAQAIMLSLAGIPGIYFHSLFGSRGDRAGADASRMPRRINRQKLVRTAVESELADGASLRARILARYAELLRVRRVHSAFGPNSAQRILASDDRVFAVLREAAEGREPVLCLHNVTDGVVEFKAHGVEAGRWLDLIDGESFTASADGSATFALRPYRTVWASPPTYH
jgi:glucosylglycerate phosphorylase